MLAVCIGLWSGCGTATVPVAPRDQEPGTAFQRLAQLEVSSGRLFQAVADQADVAGFSHQLQLQSDLADPLTPFDMERIAQSFVGALKIMLFDLAPAHFWEHHLAQYYVSTLQADEAQVLVDGYEKEFLKESFRLRELRRDFVNERLRDLLPAARAQSHLFEVSSAAMAPAVLPGDHVIVNKAAYHAAPPRRGEVVVFRYPDDAGQLFLHRVIGVPGDRIEIRDQVVSVNGQALAEPYVRHTDTSIMAGNVRDRLGPVTVPPESYFVMGDNRESSLDSRFLGSVGEKYLLGRVVFIYWSVDAATKTPRWDRLNQRVP
ncbi:MAG: signal peptidase I [Nitrospira sp.]